MYITADIILFGILLLVGMLVLTIAVFSKNKRISEFFEKILDFIEEITKSI